MSAIGVGPGRDETIVVRDLIKWVSRQMY
jgi:hypothetical protein